MNGSLSSLEAEIIRLVTYICKMLVDCEEAVRVTAKEQDGIVHCIIYVAPEDVGKIIGKGGQTAAAIRKIVSGSCRKFAIRSEIEIHEDRL